MKPVVGVVGLGLLGSAIARRLLGGGFEVVGFDLLDEAARSLESMGGRAASLGEVARAPRLLLSLPDSDAVERVAGQVEAQLTAGQVVLDTTTGDPERTAALGARLPVDYVDATVLGSSEQARQGDVIVMAGGSIEAVESCAD